MNHSIYSIDRVTHLKIVVIALAAAIATVIIALSSHVGSDGDRGAVVKAGESLAVISSKSR